MHVILAVQLWRRRMLRVPPKLCLNYSPSDLTLPVHLWHRKSEKSCNNKFVVLLLQFVMELWFAILVLLFLFNIPLRFFSLRNVQTSSAVHPTSCLVDTRVHFLGVEWQGREVDRSPPSGAWLRICGTRLMPSWHSQGKLYCFCTGIKNIPLYRIYVTSDLNSYWFWSGRTTKQIVAWNRLVFFVC